MLEIQTKNIDPDIVVLELTGRITMGRDSKQLEWSTDNLIREQKKKVVFDLTGVTHIDSTGVGILVMSAGQLKQSGGTLHVCAQGRIEEILKMTNVDKVVGLHPSLAAASAGF
jgi:anti-sigma B factor antagonist